MQPPFRSCLNMNRRRIDWHWDQGTRRLKWINLYYVDLTTHFEIISNRSYKFWNVKNTKPWIIAKDCLVFKSNETCHLSSRKIHVKHEIDSEKSINCNMQMRCFYSSNFSTNAANRNWPSAFWHWVNCIRIQRRRRRKNPTPVGQGQNCDNREDENQVKARIKDLSRVQASRIWRRGIDKSQTVAL